MAIHQRSKGGFRVLFGEALQQLRVIHISDALTVYPRRAVFGDIYFGISPPPPVQMDSG
jgi:hypothetical protein